MPVVLLSSISIESDPIMKIKSQGIFLNASFSLPIPNITAKTIPRNETKTGLKMEVTFFSVSS